MNEFAIRHDVATGCEERCRNAKFSPQGSCKEICVALLWNYRGFNWPKNWFFVSGLA